MNNKQRRVIKTKYKENCYLLASFPERERTGYGLQVKTQVSFLYDAGNVAAEWEPEYGPIQIWHKCNENDEGAKEHYYYDFENSQPGNWSQLAVTNAELPLGANRGDWDYIFAVLRDWADDH